MFDYAINNETDRGLALHPFLTNNPSNKEMSIMTNQTITEMFQSDNLKDIPGYEGLYAASRDGRAYNCTPNTVINICSYKSYVQEA